jgi:hypothetical protein
MQQTRRRGSDAYRDLWTGSAVVARGWLAHRAPEHDPVPTGCSVMPTVVEYWLLPLPYAPKHQCHDMFMHKQDDVMKIVLRP